MKYVSCSGVLIGLLRNPISSFCKPAGMGGVSSHGHSACSTHDPPGCIRQPVDAPRHRENAVSVRLRMRSSPHTSHRGHVYSPVRLYSTSCCGPAVGAHRAGVSRFHIPELRVSSVPFCFYIVPPHAFLPFGNRPRTLACHGTCLTSDAAVDIEHRNKLPPGICTITRVVAVPS